MNELDLRKKLIERRSIELTPDLAKHYLKFNTFKSQRPVKPLHVAELADKMIDGRFRFGEITFASNKNGNNFEDIMMNGQHVCCAVIESGITVPCILEKFKNLTDIEMSILFRQFEIEVRSQKDMVRVEADALGLHWPVAFSGLIVAAAKLDQRTEKSKLRTPGGGKITKEQSVLLLKKYLKEGRHIYKIIDTRSSARHLWRAPIFYIMFLTYRKDEEDSLKFWSNVKTGEYLTKERPEMKLRDFLQTVISNRTALLGRGISNHEFMVRCIRAWNSFRDGTPTRLTYRPNDKIPPLK